VFISHGHYDRCDLAAVACYPDKSVPFAVKRGLARKVRATGFENVTELEPWETAQLGRVTVTATPAKHLVPEIAAVMQRGERTVFFGAHTLNVPERRARAYPHPIRRAVAGTDQNALLEQLLFRHGSFSAHSMTSTGWLTPPFRLRRRCDRCARIWTDCARPSLARTPSLRR
jgi:hypothetical protein